MKIFLFTAIALSTCSFIFARLPTAVNSEITDSATNKWGGSPTEKASVYVYDPAMDFGQFPANLDRLDKNKTLSDADFGRAFAGQKNVRADSSTAPGYQYNNNVQFLGGKPPVFVQVD